MNINQITGIAYEPNRVVQNTIDKPVSTMALTEPNTTNRPDAISLTQTGGVQGGMAIAADYSHTQGPAVSLNSIDFTITKSTFKVNGQIPSKSISGHPDNTIYLSGTVVEERYLTSSEYEAMISDDSSKEGCYTVQQTCHKRVTGMAEIGSKLDSFAFIDNSGRIDFSLTVQEINPLGRSNYTVKMVYGDQVLDSFQVSSNNQTRSDISLSTYTSDISSNTGFDAEKIKILLYAETDNPHDISFGSAQLNLTKMSAQEVLADKIQNGITPKAEDEIRAEKEKFKYSPTFTSDKLTVSNSTFKISGNIPSESISGSPDNTIFITGLNRDIKYVTSSDAAYASIVEQSPDLAISSVIAISTESVRKSVGVARVNTALTYSDFENNYGRLDFKLRVTETNPDNKSQYSVKLMYGDVELDKIEVVNNKSTLRDITLSAYAEDFSRKGTFDNRMLHIEISAATENSGELAFGSAEIRLAKMNKSEVYEEKTIRGIDAEPPTLDPVTAPVSIVVNDNIQHTDAEYEQRYQNEYNPLQVLSIIDNLLTDEYLNEYKVGMAGPVSVPPGGSGIRKLVNGVDASGNATQYYIGSDNRAYKGEVGDLRPDPNSIIFVDNKFYKMLNNDQSIEINGEWGIAFKEGQVRHALRLNGRSYYAGENFSTSFEKVDRDTYIKVGEKYYFKLSESSGETEISKEYFDEATSGCNLNIPSTGPINNPSQSSTVKKVYGLDANRKQVFYYIRKDGHAYTQETGDQRPEKGSLVAVDGKYYKVDENAKGTEIKPEVIEGYKDGVKKNFILIDNYSYDPVTLARPEDGTAIMVGGKCYLMIDGKGQEITPADPRHPFYTPNNSGSVLQLKRISASNYMASAGTISPISYTDSLKPINMPQQLSMSSAPIAEPLSGSMTVSERVKTAVMVGINNGLRVGLSNNQVPNELIRQAEFELKEDLTKFAKSNCEDSYRVWCDFALTGRYNSLDLAFSAMGKCSVDQARQVLDGARRVFVEGEQRGASINECIAEASVQALVNVNGLTSDQDSMIDDIKYSSRKHLAGAHRFINTDFNNITAKVADNMKTLKVTAYVDKANAVSIAQNFAMGMINGFAKQASDTAYLLTSKEGHKAIKQFFVSAVSAAVELAKFTNPASKQLFFNPNTKEGRLALGIYNQMIQEANSAKAWIGTHSGNDYAQKAGEFTSTVVSLIIGTKGGVGALKTSVEANQFSQHSSKLIRLSDSPRRIADEIVEGAGKAIDPDTVKKILATPKGSRPNPITYLSKEYIENHLAKFKGGVTKFAWQAPTKPVGPPGGTFVMPKSVADELIAKSGGDVSKLEKMLGLNAGDLGPKPVRIDITEPTGLRMPDGNEVGANEFWLPGGFTSGGILEATVDQIPLDKIVVKELFK